MPEMIIPMSLRVTGSGDATEVSLFRTDRVNPNSLCMQFSLTKEDLRSGRMCFVVYDALRDEMFTALRGSSGKCVGAHMRTNRRVRRVTRR